VTDRPEFAQSATGFPTNRRKRAASTLLRRGSIAWAVLWLAACACRVQADDIQLRREMVAKAQQYLFSIQKDGAMGDSRKVTVTAAFVVASLSSGCLPSDPEHGGAIRAACDWILANGATGFLGGQEEPAADHALACLMLAELIGTPPQPDERRRLYTRAELALDYALRLQDKAVGADYHGGWRRNDQTRVNDRMVTAWYLMVLRSMGLRGLTVPQASTDRAIEFVRASQKLGGDKPDELGGFSVDASGLPVASATAAGLCSLSLFDAGSEKAIAAASEWLSRHPPRWHGPNFFETNFFAARGLYRTREVDGGRAFGSYFTRLVRILHERQDADGSFPFPPGHGAPILAMGRGYSTAMAVLILNVDRGLIPMDK